MASHFGCIGLSTASEEEFGALVERIAGEAMEDAPRGPGTAHLRWTDPSGASMALHCDVQGDELGIVCVTPFFAPEAHGDHGDDHDQGLARWRVRAERVADPACFHCGGVDCEVLDTDGETATRAIVQLLHYEPWAEALAKARPLVLEAVVFVQEAHLFDDDAAFLAWQRAEGWVPQVEGDDGTGAAAPVIAETADGERAPIQLGGLAEDAFLPFGAMLERDRPLTERAVAMLGGRVVFARRRKAAATGNVFWWVRLAALFGPVDVVAAEPSFARPPRENDLVWVTGWIVARPVEDSDRTGD